jgi:hypothetical protein
MSEIRGTLQLFCSDTDAETSFHLLVEWMSPCISVVDWVVGQSNLLLTAKMCMSACSICNTCRKYVDLNCLIHNLVSMFHIFLG